MSDYSIFNHLWTLEMAYVDCTPKQYHDWVLEHGLPICVAGRARDLTYKKIAPGVIRVSKVPLEQDKPDPKDVKIAALKAENEALKAQWIDHTKPGCGPSSAYCEELQAQLSLCTSWQPSDPGTKEAMAVLDSIPSDDPCPLISAPYARHLATALTAAMVRLEEAEKRAKSSDEAMAAIVAQNHPSKSDWCGLCKRGWSWVDGNAARQAVERAEALTASLASSTQERERMQTKINATEQWLSDNNFKTLDDAASSFDAMDGYAKRLGQDLAALTASLASMTKERDCFKHALAVEIKGDHAEECDCLDHHRAAEKLLSDFKSFDSYIGNFYIVDQYKRRAESAEASLAELRKRMGEAEKWIGIRKDFQWSYIDTDYARGLMAPASPPSPAPVESKPKEGA